MIQCFYMLAYPEKRCPKDGQWYNPDLQSPVDKFVWCDDHKSDNDIPVVRK